MKVLYVIYRKQYLCTVCTVPCVWYKCYFSTIFLKLLLTVHYENCISHIVRQTNEMYHTKTKVNKNSKLTAQFFFQNQENSEHTGHTHPPYVTPSALNYSERAVYLHVSPLCAPDNN